MASRAALVILFNVLFFAMVSSDYACPPPPKKSHVHKPSNPSTKPSKPSKPSEPSKPSKPLEPSKPSEPSKPLEPSKPSEPSKPEKCPIDTLKLGVCAKVLPGLVNIKVGAPPNPACCPLIEGLADLEAALCLCTAIEANVLGINIKSKVALSVIFNNCGRKVPSGYQCP